MENKNTEQAAGEGATPKAHYPTGGWTAPVAQPSASQPEINESHVKVAIWAYRHFMKHFQGNYLEQHTDAEIRNSVHVACMIDAMHILLTEPASQQDCEEGWAGEIAIRDRMVRVFERLCPNLVVNGSAADFAEACEKELSQQENRESG